MDKIQYKTDLPPTMGDARMRMKHTNQSIDYNLSHLYDHLDSVKTSLKKMATINPTFARQQHQKVRAETGEAFSKFDGQFSKQLKNVKRAPVMQGMSMPRLSTPRPRMNLPRLNTRVGGPRMVSPKIRTTGTFRGKSNRLGGGGRFKQLVAQGKSPALAAFIGRRRYGSRAMSAMAAAGRRRAASK